MKSAARQRTWLAAALALPVVLLALDAVYGQNQRPPVFQPQPPPPVFQPQPPVFQPQQPVFQPQQPIFQPQQPMPPIQQPPVFNPPQGPMFVTVWSCNRCGRELGRGDIKPVIDSCPGCGARLNGFGFSQGTSNPGKTPVNPESMRTGAIVLGGVVLGVGVMVGAGFLIAHLRKPARKRARRRRRDEDEDDFDSRD